MRAPRHSLQAVRLLTSVALVATSIFTISSASALTVSHFHESKAGWVNTYAAPANSSAHAQHVVAQQSSPFKNSTASSTIKVTYTDVPQAEQTAVQAAIDIWSQNWQSTVPVNVTARYVAEGTTGILASASPVNFFQGFSNAPDPTIWYPSAMANALAGKDLDPENPEIQININSSMASTFYLGTDGNCPNNQYDLESIIVHEMTHGLGFLSNDSFDPFFGYGTIDQPTPYDAFAITPDGSRLMDLPSPSVQLGNALENTLVWDGANAIAANNGVKPVLYTPNPYEAGSSVSHLDEATFQGAGANALMTPSWPAGAVFHTPGSLALAMLQDMRGKPPAGKPAGIPNAPRSVAAIVGDGAAIVSFTAPDNGRTSVVSTYTVKIDQTGQTYSGSSSPITISHLTNGNRYSFSVTASNALGTSPAATSNVVIPQAAWKSTVIDPTSDAKYLASTTLNGSPTLVYADSKNGTLKIAQWSGSKWSITPVKRPDSTTTIGSLSVCTSPVVKNKKQRLDIFYADTTNKWLRYAGYNGISWIYSVVDGNGPKVNDYTDPTRVRTSSDVSGASACVDTADGLQVFYRDMSQGIILGAVALPSTTSVNPSWNYELVDGDRTTDGRTTGDVGFHMSALNLGKRVYLLYDSVLQVNQQKQAINGEVRLATRQSAYPEDWTYQSLDSSGGGRAVAGYATALANNNGTVSGTWMASSALSLPNPTLLRFQDISHSGNPQDASNVLYGTPSAPLASDGLNLLYSCQSRLCSLNTSTQITSLVSNASYSDSASVVWVVIGKIHFAIAGSGGALRSFKAS